MSRQESRRRALAASDQGMLFDLPLGVSHPVLGRKLKLDTPCACGGSIAVVAAGKAPHAAMVRCYACDRHIQWLSHRDYQTLAKTITEIASQIGAPPEIVYRLPQHQTKQETNMAYDSLRGALFKNADKTKPTDRDYGGEVNIEGREFWISGWVNQSKKGAKYLALSLKLKDDAKPATAADMDDQIPF